jgi:hypothetical protein
MKLTVNILILIFLVSCSNKTENKVDESDTEEIKPVVSNQILSDSTRTSFPVQIGNDKGSVKIVGVRAFKDEELSSSDFIISLNDIANFSITKRIDKSVLIDSNETVLLKDSLKGDFLKSAIIKTIEFDFVRSNTLYFNAILENPLEGKEIIGRFNLFYRTKKKGVIYGWITDEIKETLHNKTYKQ